VFQSIFLLNRKKQRIRKVFHTDVFGLRDNKYKYLIDSNLKSITWNKISYQEPYYFFVPKDFSKENSYQKGINLENLFVNKNTGIQTKNDSLTLQFSKIKFWN
jgi:hypothetical protein